MDGGSCPQDRSSPVLSLYYAVVGSLILGVFVVAGLVLLFYKKEKK